MVRVRVGRLGGESLTLELPEGSTVQDALAKAEIGASGTSASVNGRTAQLDDVLAAGSTVMVGSKVAGGCL